MNFFDLVNISERFMELVNPSSPEKIIRLGKRLGLQEGTRIIDFGCGFAEPLVLWAQEFGISGLGIDVRPYACQRASDKIRLQGLTRQIEIVCADAAEYKFEPNTFDVATCLGATFIWDGYGPALTAMKGAVKPGGRLGIGEVFWLTESIPANYSQRKEDILREIDLYELTRQAGYTFAGIVRASHDDWDRYESDNWQGLLAWLAENPDHPEREEVEQHLARIQEDYLRYGRQNLGWAMFALEPVK